MPAVSIGIVLFITLAIITAIQFFYYLYFFLRLAYYSPKEKRASQQHPVSVIVCAKNEAKNLITNVPALADQQYASTFEVVVVDDRSDDNSPKILNHLQQQYKNVFTFRVENEGRPMPGKKYPLSAGIDKAKYELLLLTDADCTPASKLWLQKMQDAFTDDVAIVLGYGPYKRLPGFLNKLIRFETFHTALQYLSYALAGLPYMGVGRNLSYKKSLFYAHKGFASISQLPGGDDDLFISKTATKNNTAIVIDADTFTLSEPKTTWKSWMRQKNRHYSTAKYYKPIHKFFLGGYSLSHFLFYPLLFATLFSPGWQGALLLFLIKTMLQYIIIGRCMKKLNESDLVPWVLFMDIWMFFYYFLFARTIWEKERKEW